MRVLTADESRQWAKAHEIELASDGSDGFQNAKPVGLRTPRFGCPLTPPQLNWLAPVRRFQSEAAKQLPSLDNGLAFFHPQKTRTCTIACVRATATSGPHIFDQPYERRRMARRPCGFSPRPVL